MNIKAEERKKRPQRVVGEEDTLEHSSDLSEENSPHESETSWVNTQESILGDKPYVLPNGEIYKKRIRTVMSPAQSNALKKYFKTNPFPSAEARGVISEVLGMRPRTVQIWFQNQRQKMKHIMQEEARNKLHRTEILYTGEQGEETLWVLAHLSCAIFSASDV
ncbi:hypothetical protein NECID01_1088 [Nematocida sp. AWRm77]|nr:hypothetical protein NECID01_1088 [Nematocida sp. AWRm77]